MVGAGHNGLVCAAYLAAAGRSVVVLERRKVVGGAAREPCAYLVGLLHPQVIDDLDLRRHGYGVRLLDPQMVVPIEDGLAWVEWRDVARTVAELRRWAPGEVDGYLAYAAYWNDVRDRLRPDGDDDVWLGEPPTREQLAARLRPDQVTSLFEESMAANLARFFGDQRLIDALAPQGVIGTFAAPDEPGTASVAFHHSSGRLEGSPGDWGLVDGGMTGASAAIAAAAAAAGVVIRTGAEVERILPGEGVELADGALVEATAVVSNADPVRTNRLLGLDPPDWPLASATGKVLYTLGGWAFPEPADRSMVNVGGGVARMRAGCDAARRGELGPVWAELYHQDSLSAFVQYVPYQADHAAVERAVTTEIERWYPGFAASVEGVEVRTPADIEHDVGLTGGHIFQGDCLPDYMWDRRLAYRTGAPHVYRCGACTHPGGSVIGVNGRNAAIAVLADTRRRREWA